MSEHEIPPTHKRPLLRRLAVFLVLLLILLWFAPTIIAHTSLRDRLVRNALSDLRGEVRIGNASLGWFSPLVLENVEVLDDQGEAILSISRVESERTLLGLLLHPSCPGAFTCERPVIDLVLTEKSSNVERALEKVLKATPTSTSSASDRPSLTLRVSEGRIRLRDTVTRHEWEWNPVNLSLLFEDQGIRTEIDANGTGQSNSRIVASMVHEEVTIKADALPLKLLDTLARRLELGEWHLVGDGNILLRGRLKESTLECDEVKLALRDVRCEGPGLWFKESQLGLTGKGRVNLSSGQMELNDVVLQCPTVTAKAPLVMIGNGGLTNLGGEIEVQGDLTRLHAWVTDPKAPAAMPVAGTVVGRLMVKPSSESLEATTTLTLNNLLVGSSWSEPRVSLAGAVAYLPKNEAVAFKGLRVTTADICGAASGRLESSRLLLDRGTGFERTRLTPRVTNGAIRYAIPALAGAAEADGEFSLLLDRASLPLDDPRKGNLSGQLTIHTARLSATGPLIRELTGLVGGRSDVSLRGESKVTFKMENGLVYHEGLEIVFPEMSIRTSGWVGLDGKVAMMAEFPVPPRWLGNGAVSQSLMRQTIRIPITGTLDSPKLDQGAIREASTRIAQETAKDVLEKKIETGLNKLLKPKRR